MLHQMKSSQSNNSERKKQKYRYSQATYNKLSTIMYTLLGKILTSVRSRLFYCQTDDGATEFLIDYGKRIDLNCK